MAQTKTDNSFLADKAALRARHLPPNPCVLDCYAGKGEVWALVQRIIGKPIKRLPVDKRIDVGFHVPGDNRRFLSEVDLGKFNVIDLDAYGVPFEQLELVFDSKFQGAVFVTFILSRQGHLPPGLMEAIGFSREQYDLAKTLCSQYSWARFLEYLACRGIRRIWHRHGKAKTHMEKRYLYFEIRRDK